MRDILTNFEREEEKKSERKNLEKKKRKLIIDQLKIEY